MVLHYKISHASQFQHSEQPTDDIKPPQDAWSSLLQSLDLANVEADDWLSRMRARSPPDSGSTFDSRYSQDSKGTLADTSSLPFDREKCVSPASIPSTLPPFPQVPTSDKERQPLRQRVTRIEPRKVAPSLSCLFQWMTHRDLLLLIPALAATLAAGCIPVVMTRVLGSAFAAFLRYDRAVPGSDAKLRGQVRRDSLVLVGIAAGTIVFQFIATISWHAIAERCVRRLRRVSFSAFLHKDTSWYDFGMGIAADGKDGGPGGLLTAFNRDSDDVRVSIGVYMRTFLLHGTTLCASIVFALINCWDLTLVILASVPLLIVTTVSTEYFGAPLLACARYNTTTLASFVETSATQISTVKAFGAQDHQAALFNTTAARGRNIYSRLSCVWGSRLGICSAIGLLTFVQGFGYGFHLVNSNKASSETVVATFLATVLAMGQLQSALVVLSQVEKGKVAAAHFDAILKSHVDKRNVCPTIRPDEYRGEIVLHDVSFAYPTRPESLVLDHVSMFFPAGEHTYILGKSGSGKSSIAQLILGMYEPVAGHVVLDSHSLSHVDTQWRKENICGISQSPLILEATLYDNIALGAPAGLTRDRVYARVLDACRVMGVDEIAHSLPNGADTLVGRRGTDLSGGQKQRLALARARVRNPPVLILDEATSALDTASAARIHAAIKQWRKDRTTIVITHSISHVAPDDFCYLLADGRVADSGFRFVVEQRGRQGALSRLFLAAKASKSPPPSAAPAIVVPSVTTTQSMVPSTAVSRSKAPDNTAVSIPRRLGAASALIFLWHTLPSRLALAASLCCCILSGLTTPAFSFCLTQVLLLMQTRDTSRVGLLVGVTAVAAVVDGAFKFARYCAMEVLASCWVYSVRRTAFSHILSQDRTWHDRGENAASRLTTAVAKDTEDASALLGYVVGQATVIVIMVVGTLIYAFIAGWQLTLCTLALLPFIVAVFVVQGAMAARAERRSKNLREHVGDLVYDLAASIREVRAMSLECALERAYKIATHEAYCAGMRVALIAGSAAGLGESMTYIVEAVLYAVGGELLVHGIYDLNRFLIVINALVFAVAFSTSLAGGIPTTSKSVQAMLGVRRLLALTEDASDRKGDMCPPISGDIDFNSVTFNYADGSRGVNDVSFSVRRGERVALVGHSGCGKSTVASLLQRLYEPTSGVLSIDGHILSTLSAAHLRANLSVVGQSPMLFPATVAQNIRCGATDAQITQAEVIDAARRAHANEFVEQLPAGYDTVVGGTTSNLSGGQAQRIAVARAFARKAPILVLDEFTASLDRDTADAVVDSALGHNSCATVLVITHDPRLMQRCDRVIVMDSGTVVEQGTYGELMGRGGFLSHILATCM